MRHLQSLFRRRDRGQVMIMVAIGMVVLVGFVAVAVDVGYAMSERRQVQSAADSAAMAAAVAAMNSGGSSDIIDAAKAYGADNASVNTSDVTVNWPPTSGPHTNDKNFVQVTITKNVQRFFTGVVYRGPWKVSATATAGVVGASSDAALLALNSTSGGIKTGGSTTIKVIGGSVVSNYDINTSGSTRITADEWVNAHAGFHTSGSTTIQGGSGTNPSSDIVEDPLKDKISPPRLPTFPSDPVADVNPASQKCYTKPGWSGQKSADYVGTPGTYTCNIGITGSNQEYVFPKGDYKMDNAGVSISYQYGVEFQGGTWIFDGGSGISVGGSSPWVKLDKGNYAFLNGATFKIGGSAPDNEFGVGGTTSTDSYFYFSGGGGISAGGSDNVTLYPGTYIFDGGSGLSFSGSSKVTFEPGTYKFYFENGAGMSFSGSSQIITDPNAYVQAWFLGSASQSSSMDMSGSTSFSIPSGEYYFDYGNFIDSGSSTISGSNVFLYFDHKSYLKSSGSAAFGFTAPTTQIYPGYYPGVFMYANSNDTQTFYWTGSTSAVSYGAVYLPSATLSMSGASSSKVMVGQLIANSFTLSGSNNTTIEYKEYVSTATPKVYLVQ